MEGAGRVYLSLVYPINTIKSVTVGLFEKFNFEVGVLFTQHGKKSHILLDFNEWNCLLLFNNHNTPSSSFLCEENVERENKTTVKRTRSFLQITDSNNVKFVFNKSDLTRFADIQRLLSKYIVRLFYDQDHFKLYINQVVTQKRYVQPYFFFPSYFRGETDRHDQQLTFDRLYDELVMYGRVGEILVTPEVQCCTPSSNEHDE